MLYSHDGWFLFSWSVMIVTKTYGRRNTSMSIWGTNCGGTLPLGYCKSTTGILAGRSISFDCCGDGWAFRPLSFGYYTPSFPMCIPNGSRDARAKLCTRMYFQRIVVKSAVTTSLNGRSLQYLLDTTCKSIDFRMLLFAAKTEKSQVYQGA